MVVVDATTGKVVADVPIGTGPDAAGFDPDTGLAFSSNGEGTLTIIHQDSADKYSVVENVATQKYARTMTVDSKTHNVYLVTAEFGAPPADRPNARGPLVANSFSILVFGK